MRLVFHLAARDEWERCDPYAPASLAREGFVHCSTRAQVIATANAYFAGRRDVVLLAIDAGSLGDALRWEPPAGTAVRAAGELFPHVYAAIDRAAVVRAIPLVPRTDGFAEQDLEAALEGL